MLTPPVKFCYVSAAEDRSWLEKLQVHLVNLRSLNLLVELDTSDIEQATLVLLLISAPFLNSPVCIETMLWALQRAEQEIIHVIPILLSSVDYKDQPFAKLKLLPNNAKPVTKWRDRNEAFTNVAKAIRSLILPATSSSTRLPPDHVQRASVPLPAPAPRQTASRRIVAPDTALPDNVPALNPYFTGQDAVLAALRERFVGAVVTVVADAEGHPQEDDPTRRGGPLRSEALARPEDTGNDAGGRRTAPISLANQGHMLVQALTGMPGVGKTQLAIAYAQRYRAAYNALLWVDADSREALVPGFIALAELLHLPASDAQDQNIPLQAIKRWLATHAGWLLILDNVEDLNLLRNFLPATRIQGHILLTMRDSNVGTLAQGHNVALMSSEENVLLLLRRAKIIGPAHTLDRVPTVERAEAEEVVRLLGGLPLALDQAGAYIEENNCSIAGYIKGYQAQHNLLLQRRGALATHTPEHPTSVATTWELSLQRVATRHPAAVELLCLCAFLHPSNIPISLFIEGARALSPDLQALAHNPVAFDEAVRTLHSSSLLHRDRATQTLSLHRLLQTILLDGMGEAQSRQTFAQVVKSGNCVFPDPTEIITWHVCKIYILHAQFLVSFATLQKINNVELALLCNRAGMYLYFRAQYNAAQPLYQYALDTFEQLYGSDHADIAACLANLADLACEQGHYPHAETLYQRALAMSERLLGKDHPDVIYYLNSLVDLYRYQGKYKQAESVCQRAIDIIKHTYGPTHFKLALHLNNLGKLYEDQGKYKQAETILKRAISLLEQAPEKATLDSAVSITNLAMLYESQSKYEQADLLYKRALSIRENELGSNHPEVAKNLNNMGVLYGNQGNYEQAELFLQRALQIYEQVYDADHPIVARSISNLAVLYHEHGDYEQADLLYQRTLKVINERLDANYLFAVNIMENRANLLLKMQRSEEATELMTRASELRAKGWS